MEEFEFNNELLAMQDELLRFARKLTTDKERAKDLLQDTLLRALDNSGKYNMNINFKGWVYTIMHNIFVNNCRNESKYSTLYLSSDYADIARLVDNSSFATAENGYDAGNVQKVLMMIPKEYSTPFMLYAAGFKYREIADKMNLSIGTVKSRIFYCRKRLKVLLSGLIN